jgi:pimeloyl-ACP methyl ester carboxylesterase
LAGVERDVSALPIFNQIAKKNRPSMIRVVVCVLLVSALPVIAGNPVHWSEAVEVNGVKQWISATGNDSDMPVLLFLHGGPGNSVMSYAEKFTNHLRKEFIVVLWDQRNSGETSSLNAEPSPVSLKIMREDAEDVVNYLRAKFSRDRIYLAGHSWGGLLALQVAKEHPALLHACFAISPMINQNKSEQMSLAWMEELARSRGNRQAIDALAGVRVPFERMEDLYTHRKWLAIFSGTVEPKKSFVAGWSQKWLPLLKEASALDLSSSATDFKCPVYFFVGKKDRQTHFQVTEDYWRSISAKKKELFWFLNSGHSLNLTEPKKLQEIIFSLKTP